MTRYVQHSSGQGEKYPLYEVDWTSITQSNRLDYWIVNGPTKQFILPRSDYHLCEPPEIWVDVTSECEIPIFTRPEYKDHCEVWHKGTRLFVVGNELVTGYRLSKVKLAEYHATWDEGKVVKERWALIAEKKS